MEKQAFDSIAEVWSENEKQLGWVQPGQLKRTAADEVVQVDGLRAQEATGCSCLPPGQTNDTCQKQERGTPLYFASGWSGSAIGQSRDQQN